MKTLIERHDGVLRVDEKTALKFCKEWYQSKRQETSAIWKQRKQRVGNTHEFSLSELQEQVREIVERKRTMKPPEKTLTNDEYRKLRREGLEKMIEWKKRNQINSQCCGGQWQEKTHQKTSKREKSEGIWRTTIQ